MKSVYLILILIQFANSEVFSIRKCFVDVLQNVNSSIAPECARQLVEYTDNLGSVKNSWASQMLDATSKLQSGVMSLNYGQLGNFDQCISVRAPENIVGKYCLGFMSLDQASNETAAQIFLLWNSFRDFGASPSTRAEGPTWAVCVPNACNGPDVNIVVKRIFSSCFEIDTKIQFNDLFCQTIDQVNPKLDLAGTISLSFFVFLLATVLICTCYDVYQQINGQECCYSYLRIFSAYSNGRQLFRRQKTTADELSCLNGLKVISMMWIIFGHQHSIFVGGPITNNKDLINWANNWHSMFVIGGNYAVDTFFLASGILVAYNFQRSRLKNQPFNFVYFYTHRYLRLTAGLSVIVLFHATLLKYTGSGPRWPLINTFFQQYCVDYWWSTLLHVQNYVNVQNMCVGQSWYVAVDMQLYFISPALCFVLSKWPKSGVFLIIISIFSVITLSFLSSWSYDLTAILTNFFGKPSDYSNQYYLLTHTRASPWLIGVCLGFTVAQLKAKNSSIKLHKIIEIFLWMLSFAILLTCIFFGFSTLRDKQYDKLGNALHIALVRPAWSMAVSWIVFACIFNYGKPINFILSLNIYKVLLPFTYTIYLIHVTLLFSITYSKKSADYFSEFNMAYYFWGTLWFSASLSIIVVFTAEMPVVGIEKMLFSQKSKTKTEFIPKEGIVNLGFRI